MQRNPIWSLLISVLALVILYFVLGGIWTFLRFSAPVLLVITAIIDHKTIITHVKWLWDLLRRSPLNGVFWLVINILLYPLTAAFLLATALLRRTAKKYTQQFEAQAKEAEGIFVNYEELPLDPIATPEVREILTNKKTDTAYDVYFEEEPKA